MAIWCKVKIEDGYEKRIYSKWYEDIKISKFKTTKDVLDYFINHDYHYYKYKMMAEIIADKQPKRVIGFGSGMGGYEYFLKLQFPTIEFVASDYEPKCIALIRTFLHNITGIIFDFYRDDISNLGKFDMAIMISSSYAMDNKCFLKFHKELFKNDVKHVIDFHGGIPQPSIRFDICDEYIKIVYGYARTIEEHNKLYDDTGYKQIQWLHLKKLKSYVAIVGK